MERARLKGDDDQAQRLEGIAWRLGGWLDRHRAGSYDNQYLHIFTQN